MPLKTPYTDLEMALLRPEKSLIMPLKGPYNAIKRVL